MDWQRIVDAKPPQYEPLLFAARYEPQHLEWKFGVGSFSDKGKLLWDWPWTFPPQWWKRIDPPTSDKP